MQQTERQNFWRLPMFPYSDEVCAICEGDGISEKKLKMFNFYSYPLCENCGSKDSEQIIEEIVRHLPQNGSRHWSYRRLLRLLDGEGKWLSASTKYLLRRAVQLSCIAVEEIEGISLREAGCRNPEYKSMLRNFLREKLYTLNILVLPGVTKKGFYSRVKSGKGLDKFLMRHIEIEKEGVAVSPPEIEEIEEEEEREPDWLIKSRLKSPIETLNLSRRIEDILFSYGISTIGDLTGLTEKELARFKYLGRRYLKEIENKLAHFGLTLSTKRAPVKRGKFQHARTSAEMEVAAEELLGKEEFSLFKRVRFRKDKSWLETRNKLVEMNLDLVKALTFNYRYKPLKLPQVKRLVDSAISEEDVFQEGVIGLIYAVENFDYTQGTRFSTYAVPCIVGFIKRSFEQLSRVPSHVYQWINKVDEVTTELWGELERRPTTEEIANKMGFSIDWVEKLLVYARFKEHPYSLDAPLHDAAGEEEDLILKEIVTYSDELPPLEKEMKEDLKEIINQLIEEAPFSEIEKFCLRLYRGLDGNSTHSLEATGDILGVTRERVRQLLEKWTSYFQDPRTKNRLRDYLPKERIRAWEEVTGTFPSDTGSELIKEEKTGLTLDKDKISPVKILQAVSLFYDISVGELVSGKGETPFLPRWTVIYLLRSLGLSHWQVAREVGEKEVNLVVFGCNRMAQMLKQDLSLNHDLELIKQIIEGRLTGRFICIYCGRKFSMERACNTHRDCYCKVKKEIEEKNRLSIRITRRKKSFRERKAVRERKLDDQTRYLIEAGLTLAPDLKGRYKIR